MIVIWASGQAIGTRLPPTRPFRAQTMPLSLTQKTGVFYYLSPNTLFMKMRLLFILIMGFSINLQLLAQNAFLNKLQPYCGKSYSGQVKHPTGDKDPFAGKSLVIHFKNCNGQEIRIPFAVGDDHSRTWILTQTDQGLLLKHDHRLKDGTPDEVTMYGGFANENSDSWSAIFPADEYTAELLPAAATNEWTLALSKDGKMLSYMLRRDGTLRFQADFDLEKAME